VDVVIAEFETANDKAVSDTTAKKAAVSAEVKEVLGVKISEITGPLSRQFDLKEDIKGAVVVGLSSDSPAIAFLKPGDVITEVNRTEVKSPDEVLKIVEKETANKKKNITFLVNRAGEIVYITVKNEDDLKSDADEAKSKSDAEAKNKANAADKGKIKTDDKDDDKDEGKEIGKEEKTSMKEKKS